MKLGMEVTYLAWSLWAQPTLQANPDIRSKQAFSLVLPERERLGNAVGNCCGNGGQLEHDGRETDTFSRLGTHHFEQLWELKVRESTITARFNISYTSVIPLTSSIPWPRRKRRWWHIRQSLTPQSLDIPSWRRRDRREECRRSSRGKNASAPRWTNPFSRIG